MLNNFFKKKQIYKRWPQIYRGITTTGLTGVLSLLNRFDLFFIYSLKKEMSNEKKIDVIMSSHELSFIKATPIGQAMIRTRH